MGVADVGDDADVAVDGTESAGVVLVVGVVHGFGVDGADESGDDCHRQMDLRPRLCRYQKAPCLNWPS